MSDPTDDQNPIARMMTRMELRGLRPNTVSTFAGCARRFLEHAGKAPEHSHLKRHFSFTANV
jgi:hypothetical protein